MPEIHKMFKLNKALKEQRIVGAFTDAEDSNVLINTRHLNNFESEREISIRELNEKYLDILEAICNGVLNNKSNEISRIKKCKNSI
jgi:hypothetical protein